MKAVKNIIAVVLALLILAGSAVGIGRAVTGSWDIREWGKKPDTEQNQPETSDDNGGAVINESASNGIKLMSARIAPTAYPRKRIAHTR